MSKESQLDNIEGLIRKKLEETEISQNMIVYSQRTAFVYGEENDAMKVVPMEQFLLEILTDKGPITRSTLVALTNMPRTTLYDVLSKLIMKGKVARKPVRMKKRGRPKVLFTALANE